MDVTKFEDSPLRQLGLRINVKNESSHDFTVDTHFEAPGTITIVISDAAGQIRIVKPNVRG